MHDLVPGTGAYEPGCHTPTPAADSRREAFAWLERRLAWERRFTELRAGPGVREGTMRVSSDASQSGDDRRAADREDLFARSGTLAG